MKKGIYLHPGSKTNFSGVDNKIKDQIKALSVYYDVAEIIIEKEKNNIVKSCLWRLPFGSMGRCYKQALKDIEEIAQDSGVSFFYIRYFASDLRFIMFLNQLKKIYPMARVILEIATFPYDKELLQSKTMWPWFYKDKVYRNRLKKYIDTIITYSVDKEIYGIPTISIMNGIDVDRIKPKIIHDDSIDKINLIAVAQFQPSHGYERLLQGIEQYYSNGGTRSVQLHMVGNGSEVEGYKKLVHKLQLEDIVIFHGALFGQDLDIMYNYCDIGMAAMGFYKRGINRSSELKVREYLAKGLPVACGAPSDVFTNNRKQFCIEYPNDATAIDVEKMIKWYDELVNHYDDKRSLSKKIREFAYNAVDIRSTMKPVIDYLNK